MKRHAFTLLELIVVMGIIGILFSLTMPAIQRVREAARRVQCQNNLRQIGIALHAYQSSYNVFPAPLGGALLFGPGAGGDSRFFSPFTFLLPYLDAEPLFGGINFEVRTFDPAPGWDGPENRTVFAKKLAIFLCPTDPSSSSDLFTGRNNFRFNLGTGPIPRGATANGAFVPGKWDTPAAFLDGLSFTAGVSEKIKGDGSDSRYTSYSDVWYCEPRNTYPNLEQLEILCAAPSSSVPPHYSFGGESWFHAGFYWTWYNHGLTPNHTVPDCTPAIHAGVIPGLFTARSMHPGGVSVLLMDGNVRFIPDSVDLGVWRAIGTRAGSEQIDSTAF